jgi:glucose/arabinose dehydrogenase
MDPNRNRKSRAIHVLAILTGLAIVPTIAGGSGEPLEDPIPEPIEEGPVAVRLDVVATGLTAPNWGTAVPGCDDLAGRLVVTDQPGVLWAVDLESGEKTVLLDVSDRLVALGVAGPGTFDERGLLGVAFHPDFAHNGRLYTYTSEPVSGNADFSTIPGGLAANHQSVIHEWRIPEPCAASSVVDPDTARELLRVDQPQFNHNAGTLAFGPDRMLYVSLGDGGAADDQGIGHTPQGNAQHPGNVLGTILRIDPDGNDSTNGRYGIPEDNPFAEVAEIPDEVFAYGLRNPFRFSFDSQTGEMLITDVGQNDIEEINLGVAGGNYGWRVKAGSFCFDPNGMDAGFVFECDPEDVPSGLIDPIAEYDHDEGIAIIGGFVYRGREIPQLRGRYVFGDFFHPASGGGRLFYLERDRRILELGLEGAEGLGMSLDGFGQDTRGEIYLLANETGTPFGDTGVVMKLVPGGPPSRIFRARLVGAEEVPAVETHARGEALFRVTRDGSALAFELVVARIDDVVASHVHCAPAGTNGPVGVTLFSGGPVSTSGPLAGGTIEAADSGNACGWTTLDDVIDAMRAGGAYVNVHTLAHPPGEIRGQLSAVPARPATVGDERRRHGSRDARGVRVRNR